MIDYLLLTAIASEYAAVRRALPPGRRHHAYRSHFCEVNSHTIALVQMGLGSKPAKEAVRWGIEFLEPRHVIVIGTAGALRIEFQLGDIILPESVLSASGEVRDVAPVRVGGKTFQSIQKPRLEGPTRLIESPIVVSTSAAKTSLHQTMEADAVDMESFTVVNVCNQLGLSVSVVRFISDTLEHYFPPEIPLLLNEQGNPNYFRILMAILRRPGLYAELRELQRDSKVCGDAITEWTTSFRQALTTR